MKWSSQVSDVCPQNVENQLITINAILGKHGERLARVETKVNLITFGIGVVFTASISTILLLIFHI